MICAIPFGDRSYLRPSFETGEDGARLEGLRHSSHHKGPHHMSGAHFPLFLLAALSSQRSPAPAFSMSRRGHCRAAARPVLHRHPARHCGGLVHVVAGGLGVSAIILASAQLFTAFKFVGALYLVWLGIKTFRDAGAPAATADRADRARRARFATASWSRRSIPRPRRSSSPSFRSSSIRPRATPHCSSSRSA